MENVTTAIHFKRNPIQSRVISLMADEIKGKEDYLGFTRK